MLVVMKAHASEEDVRSVCERIQKLGYRAHAIPGAQRTAIGITGSQGEVEIATLEEMPGVAEVIKVSKPYKLVSRDVKDTNTVIRFPNSDATIGGTEIAVMAGPCGVETREQAFAVATARGPEPALEPQGPPDDRGLLPAAPHFIGREEDLRWALGAVH